MTLSLFALPSLFSFGVRQKMILVVLSVLTIALATTGWMAFQQQEREIVRSTGQHEEDVARYVSTSLAFSVIGYDYQTIQFLLDELTKSEEIVYAKVMNSKGGMMAEAGSVLAHVGSRSVLERDIVFDNKKIGQLQIVIDNTRIINQLKEQKLTLVMREAVIVLLIALGEFFALSYIIVRPVSVIANALAKGVDEHGKITGDIPLNSSDEFGKLATLFNDMRSQLNEANVRLQSKIELADARLQENNERLRQQAIDMKSLNEELRRLSITDPLTGLHNRRHFDNMMETDLALSHRHGEISSIVIVDLDHFKNVNDIYGHKVGDRVLSHVANILKANLRKTDTICRIGGEEFVVICRRAGNEDAITVGEKLRRMVEINPLQAGKQSISLTISIGISSLPPNEKDIAADEIFRKADAALYYSKEHGRNRVTHYDAIKGEVNEP